MKIVCFGDSITYGSLVDDRERYFGCLENMFPAHTFVNAGVAGNTSSQGRVRFEQDVLAEEPDVCVIFFGMNDTRCDDGVNVAAVGREEYRSNLFHFGRVLKDRGCKLIYCTIHNVIEGDGTQYYYARHPQQNYQNPVGINAWLDDYSSVVKEVAGELDAAIADVNRTFKAFIAGGGSLDEVLLTVENSGLDDGVHPNAKGHRMIADVIAEKLRSAQNNG